MDKPKQQKRESFDYHECATWVGHKLGYDIRDTLGTQIEVNRDKHLEYRDWWHYLIEHKECQNGSYVAIDDDLLESGNDWQNEITRMFISEFGEGVEYYVWW